MRQFGLVLCTLIFLSACSNASEVAPPTLPSQSTTNGLAITPSRTAHASNTLVQSYSVGCPQNEGFFGSALSADKSKLYIASIGPGGYAFYVLDTTTNTFSSPIPIEQPIVELAKRMWGTHYYSTGPDVALE